MSQTTQTALKVIVIVHLVLASWAMISFQGSAYLFMNSFLLAVGLWAIIAQDSIDAVFMFFMLNVLSILMDIIFISIYASATSDNSGSYKFSLGMAILNLIIRPLSSFILYRLYQDRTGELQFPQYPAFEDSNRGYSTIDQPVYPSAVETATPHN